VVVVTEILVPVGHVLRSVDVEVFTLAVSDGEAIRLSNLAVLTEISAQERAIGLTIEVLEHLVVGESGTEKRKQFPAKGHVLEVANAADSFNSEPDAASPSENAVAVEGIVQISKAIAVLKRDII
jgi:predicted P-loop ATPase/GTPase